VWRVQLEPRERDTCASERPLRCRISSKYMLVSFLNMWATGNLWESAGNMVKSCRDAPCWSLPNYHMRQDNRERWDRDYIVIQTELYRSVYRRLLYIESHAHRRIGYRSRRESASGKGHEGNHVVGIWPNWTITCSRCPSLRLQRRCKTFKIS